MPKLSKFMIRTSLLYLGIGSVIGSLLLLQKSTLIFEGNIWQLLVVHIELMIFGWIIQMVLGVSFWMLPKFNQAPIRGNEKWVWATWILLNSGIFFNCFGSIFFPQFPLHIFGTGLEWISVLCYLPHAWQRVKPFMLG